jgi:hypothetical protein
MRGRPHFISSKQSSVSNFFSLALSPACHFFSNPCGTGILRDTRAQNDVAALVSSLKNQEKEA